MPIPHAPAHFRGSFAELYRDHLEAVLPDISDIYRFHRWMARYCDEPAAVFPVRSVTGAQRRDVYLTADGTQIAPADNSPAWVVHATLMERRLTSYDDFCALMLTMPSHMFDVRKSIAVTAHDSGWYLAHIFPAKNGDTNFLAWNRREVVRRFYLTLHPCNLFFVPGVRNRKWGEDPKLIRFVASKFAIRYSAIWGDFMDRAQLFFSADSDLGCEVIEFDHNLPEKPAVDISLPPFPRTDKVKVSYKAYRLTFKRDAIEALGVGELFEVVTPMGVYRLSKEDFYQAFPRIPETASYRKLGLYHGAKLHLKAQRFRVLD